MEAIRITGLFIASPDGSGKDLGRHQSAINSSARSDVPTQAIYRPTGITISRRHIPYYVTRANAVIADSS
jgi:hypothetical protein